jgi:hypothetical protein
VLCGGRTFGAPIATLRGSRRRTLGSSGHPRRQQSNSSRVVMLNRIIESKVVKQYKKPWGRSWCAGKLCLTLVGPGIRDLRPGACCRVLALAPVHAVDKFALAVGTIGRSSKMRGSHHFRREREAIACNYRVSKPARRPCPSITGGPREAECGGYTSPPLCDPADAA